MRRGSVLVVLAWMSVPACSGEQTYGHTPVAHFGSLAVYDAYASASPLSDVASVYFTVANSGVQADTLNGVGIPIGTAHLHEVVTENDLTRMRPVGMLPVPAHGELRLEPGRYHLMLSQMDTGLSVGDTILVELEFAWAGSHRIPVVVLTYTEILQRLGRAQDIRR